jgi:1-acyl-sn-glycerol-3-phosphate acyltransferase
MSQPFILLYQYFQKHKIVLFAFIILFSILSIFFTSKINFVEDVSRVIPADKKSDEINQVFNQSKFLERIVVHIYTEDTIDENILFQNCDTLVNRLSIDDYKKYYSQLEYQVPEEAMMQVYEIIQNNLPLFLEEKDYAILEKRITDESIKSNIQNNYIALISPTGFALKNSIVDDPLHFVPIVLEKLKSFQLDENFITSNGYIISKDKKHLLFFVHPKATSNKTGYNDKLIEAIDNSITQTIKLNNSSAKIEYFGGTAVSVANARQIKKDIIFTTILALVLLYLFITYYFRDFKIFFLLFVPIAFGSVVSLGILYFVLGTVSSIALGVGSILLGIAINLSLHIFTHFKQHGTVEEVIKDITTPSIVTALTTSCAFFCLLFLESDAMKDLGLFAGISILITTLSSLVITPHILQWQKNISQKNTIIDSIASYDYHKKIWIIIPLFLVFFASLFVMNKVEFEADLNQMSYVPKSLSDAENHLDQLSNYKLKNVFLISSANNLDEALDLNNQAISKVEALKKNNTIAKYTNVSLLLSSKKVQDEKIKRWNEFWADKKDRVLSKTTEEGVAMGFNKEAFDIFSSNLNRKYSYLNSDDEQILRTLFVDDYISQSKNLTTVVTLMKVPNDNKKSVYDAFANDTHHTVVDKQYMAKKFVDILVNNFNLLLYLSFGIVFIIILISFGRIELTLLCVLPMMMSWCITLGIMALFHIKFNVFNIIISTFIFGMGDDFSVFLVSGLQQKYTEGKDNIKSYKTSILLATITTLVGIGVLIFAKHPAMRSIAMISIIGISSVVIVSYTIQPLLFNFFVQRRKEKAKVPVILSEALMSVYAFGYFFIGCIVLTIVGLITVVPFGRIKSVKYFYHWCISKYCWTLLHTVISMKKVTINDVNETLSKPAVIIANHSSFVDILVILALHPKIIMLTNDWVYNKSPFALVVRMAGFYHVEEGHESSEAKLKKMIDDGYHVMAFPEGTRSFDQNKLGRFHKGIFYIAERFNLDIVPVLLHGIGHANHKSEFLQQAGQATVKYLPRITPDNQSYGENYSQRTPRISKYFKEEFEKLRQEIETPSYFYPRVMKNYVLKSPPWLEWYVRVKLKLANSYTQLLSLVPKNQTLYDIGCGYGYIALLAHQISPNRNIIGIDFDEEKINVANNVSTKNEHLTFHQSDARTFEFTQKASFIISDVLHYIKKEEQFDLLKRCINMLDENGVIIIREADSNNKKHTNAEWTERWSTFLGFNKAKFDEMEFISFDDLKKFFESNNMSLELNQSSSNTSNNLYIAKRK